MSLEVSVTDAAGKTTDTVTLPAEIFDCPVNIPLMHQVVNAQLAAARQGTHATKTRSQVAGGGKKPYRQKGTGRARQGSIRAPQYAGGGVVHGPQPRDYSQRTPKKMKAAALRSALSDRAANDVVHIITELIDGDTPKTKTALTALRNTTTVRRVLVVLTADENAAWLSLRNEQAVHLLRPDQLNTHDVLVNDALVFSKAAYDAFVSGKKANEAVEATA